MSITPVTQRYGTNWEEQLAASEVITKKEGNRELKVVLLRGLQRLAQLAGLTASHCKLDFISKDQTGTVGIMQAIYTTEFSDGTSWVGTADCNSANTDSNFMKYPTAVAESRAEARCLRKALNIQMLSFEEIAFSEGGAVEQIVSAPGKAIDSQVIKAIEKLCETRGTAVAEMLEAVLSKDRNGAIFELTELTVDEGQKAMAWLNEQKPAKTKTPTKTAAEERAARKAELLAETKD